MLLVSKEELIENGVKYLIETFDNGSVVKRQDFTYTPSDQDIELPQEYHITNEDIDAKLTETQNIVIDAMSGMADLYETAMSNQQMQLDTMSGLADLFDIMVASEGGTTN